MGRETRTFEFVERRQPTDVRTLRGEQHFSDVAVVLDKMMRGCGLAKAENPRDPGLDGALTPQPHKLIHPTGHAIDFIPHVAEVDAEDAFVRVHQGERIELEPRGAGEHRHHAEHAPSLVRGRRRSAENSKPTRGRQQPIAFLERLATHRVEDEFDTPALSDLARTLFEILGPIVDQMVDAERAHSWCLAADAVPMTLAPRCLAIWVAATPTPPPAEWTSIVSPALSVPMTTIGCQAV